MSDTPSDPELSITDPTDGTVWTFDTAFLESNWTCIWGAGCKGILDSPAEHLGQGCCSLGAELLDDTEAMNLAALATCIDPDRFEHAKKAERDGIFSDNARRHTRVVDGACIFFNSADFAGGPGCALHLQALHEGDPPDEWKPSICWQLPLKVDRSAGGARLRRFGRDDWGSGGASMAWCCTEPGEAYVGNRPVVETLGHEIEALVGHEVMVELQRRLPR